MLMLFNKGVYTLISKSLSKKKYNEICREAKRLDRDINITVEDKQHPYKGIIAFRSTNEEAIYALKHFIQLCPLV